MTPITRHPLHGSRRAVFPHQALQQYSLPHKSTYKPQQQLYRARWLAWFRLFVLRSLADAPKKFFGHTPFRRLPLHQSNSRVCVRSTISFTSNKRNRMTNHRPNKKNRHKPITPQPLKTINPNTAGIDIGSSEIYVAVPPDRNTESVKVFASFTRDLHELTQWLLQSSITSVAMESTGVYWIPLYDILQHAGIESVWSMHVMSRTYPAKRLTSSTANGSSNCTATDYWPTLSVPKKISAAYALSLASVKCFSNTVLHTSSISKKHCIK